MHDDHTYTVSKLNSLLTEMITPQTCKYIFIYTKHIKPLPVSRVFGACSGSSRITAHVCMVTLWLHTFSLTSLLNLAPGVFLASLTFDNDMSKSVCYTVEPQLIVISNACSCSSLSSLALPIALHPVWLIPCLMITCSSHLASNIMNPCQYEHIQHPSGDP